MCTIIKNIQRQYSVFAEKEREDENDPGAIFVGFYPWLGGFGLCLSCVFPSISLGLVELVFYIGSCMDDASNPLKAFFFFVLAFCYILFLLTFILSFPSLVLFGISLLALLIAPITSCMSILAILGVIIIPAIREESYIEMGDDRN